MGTFTTATGSVGQYQTEFTTASDTTESATLDTLLPTDGDEVLIAVRTYGTAPLTTSTSSDNSIDIDVVIDRLQNTLREAGYKF
jgi:hypothetical protein